MQSLSRLTLFLCCVWAVSLLYGEMFAYWVPLWTCSWPQPQSSPIENGSQNQARIAVLADPQIMDRTSLPLPPRSFLFETAKFYTDLYMRRSFHASVMPFNPDMILFLGDQFDGGLYLSDEEICFACLFYELIKYKKEINKGRGFSFDQSATNVRSKRWYESLNRFRSIFDPRNKEENSGIKINYLSGNHDIGYSCFHALHMKEIRRYEEGFQERNYHFNIQGVQFIVVDAQTLDGSVQGNLTSKSWEFVKNISREAGSNPRVLLTHIPLYRPNGTPCGPYRSSPIIDQRIIYAGNDIAHGTRYQNYLTEETTRRLLDLIQPVLVLSGHDHDQCTITHSTAKGPVTEHTVGTVSWQQGNLFPSFMLLSVSAPASSNLKEQEAAVSTHLCFLPMQTHIYIWYLSLFIITLFLVTFWPTSGFGCWDRCEGFFRSVTEEFVRSFSTSKEKNEDENREYEMVWDAEGSMHLVKKANPVIPLVTSSDKALPGRGTVTSRPQARKLAHEVDASICLEMNSDGKMDDFGRGSQLGKSIGRKVIQRLIRVTRLLTIIATVNVPLYMMMLFKDWIER